MSEETDRSFNDRISGLRLSVADYLEKQEAGHAAEEAGQLLRRIAGAVNRFSFLRSLVSELNDVPLSVRPVSPKLVTAIGKARTTLRRTSTQLKQPDREVRDLLTTPSMSAAIVDVERLLADREAAIRSAFDTFRENVRPEGLLEVQADGLEPLGLALKVRRLQQVCGSSASVPLEEILASVRKIQDAVQEWEAARGDVEAAQRRVSPTLRAFFERLNGPPGFTAWSNLHDEVRAWLDTDTNGDDYVVVRRDNLP